MYFVKDLLQEKGENLYTITPATTLREALTLMAEKQIGALVVVEDDHLAGIFSERDLARGVIRVDACSLEDPVSKVMSSPVITVNPQQTLEEVMVIMMDNHIRHLPVVEGEHARGMISIRDVLRAQIQNRERDIQKLEGYISGTDYIRS
jgi:CBS domain-containing protein